ncbi:hypothetical protein EIP91_009358 [Steccherinum ochraceum]|uniref:Uncharacterized protein n=1 Tax=Steccherinum ochraceum TaxID=92696 RepID=A0A4R0RXR9_9APHY|nr:hypothetical protein EIP91_009358 [Steccherinum ochraceum]
MDIKPEVMTASSAPSLIQQFDEKIFNYRRAAVSLSQQRNALLPACRCPPEILSTIFQLYVTSVHGRLSQTSRAQPPFEWIAGVTHTCHYWREVALGTSMLWTIIPVTHCRTEVIEAFVQRSGTAPLVVDTAREAEEEEIALFVPSDRLSLLRSVFGRIGSLKVQLTNELYPALFPQEFTNTPASLHTLVMGLSYETIQFHEFPFPLADETFVPKRTISSLQHLDVRRYSVTWDPSVFPKTLTHLCIDNMHEGSPMSDVVNVISSLGALQELTLCNVIDIGSNIEPLSLLAKRSILRSLAIISLFEWSTLTASYSFLDHFQLPSLRNLEVTTDYPTPTNFEQDLAILRILIPRIIIPQAPIHRLHLPFGAFRTSRC